MIDNITIIKIKKSDLIIKALKESNNLFKETIYCRQDKLNFFDIIIPLFEIHLPRPLKLGYHFLGDYFSTSKPLI